jgi:ribA/ribD-fused uncharacterized protein
VNVKPITSFRGEYFFLSNFDTEPFKCRGILFPSGEHAFVYGKLGYLTDPGKESALVEQLLDPERTPRPQDARNLGSRRNITIRAAEWDKQSPWWMRELTHAKFSYVREYAGKLINTGCGMLVEGNDWGDKRWGRVLENGKWVGLNLLGSILMEERGWWSRGDIGRP